MTIISMKMMIANYIEDRKDDKMENELFDGLFENSTPNQDAENEKAVPDKAADVKEGLPEVPERELTPLEKMKIAKESKPTGLVIDTPKEQKLYKNPAEAGLSDNTTESLNEMDSMIEKIAFAREHNLMKDSIDSNSHSPEDISRRLEVIHDISNLQISDDKKTLTVKAQNPNDIGEKILANKFTALSNVTPDASKHFILNKENTVVEGVKPEGVEEPTESKSDSTDENNTTTENTSVEEDLKTSAEEKAKREESVTVILNK